MPLGSVVEDAALCERVARLSIEFAISKARAVMALVESWER